MLTTLAKLRLKRATDAALGNVQSFIDRLLVEVTAENYRYFLTEHLSIADDAQDKEAPALCWPPLLSNERQVSGLFAVGLSRVCPVSSPEHPIARSRRAPDDAGIAVRAKKGRIDFLAHYGNRHIGLELKRCPISTLGNARAKAGLTYQWKTVSEQAKQALTHMKSIKANYDNPVSVGLLVVRVSRKVTSRIDVESARHDAAASLPGIAGDVLKLTKADCLAYYASPPEMQISGGWGKSGKEHYVFPGVVFAAVVHGNAKHGE